MIYIILLEIFVFVTLLLIDRMKTSNLKSSSEVIRATLSYRDIRSSYSNGRRTSNTTCVLVYTVHNEERQLHVRGQMRNISIDEEVDIYFNGQTNKAYYLPKKYSNNVLFYSSMLFWAIMTTVAFYSILK